MELSCSSPGPLPSPHLLPFCVHLASIILNSVQFCRCYILIYSPGLQLMLFTCSNHFSIIFFHTALSYSSRFSIGFLSSKRVSLKLQAGLATSSVFLGCSVPLHQHLSVTLKYLLMHFLNQTVNSLRAGTIFCTSLCSQQLTQCPANQRYVYSMSLEVG